MQPMEIKGPNMAFVNPGWGKRVFDKIVWGDKAEELEKWEKRELPDTELTNLLISKNKFYEQ